MYIALSQSNPDPMYRQVTDQIKHAIATAELKPGEKLPSIRELAEALKISVITIKRAYLELEREGLILTRAGLGCFVTEIDRVNLRGGKLEEIRADLTRILRSGAKYGISAEDVVSLVRQIEEE